MEKNTVILDIDRYNELLEAAVRYELMKEKLEETNHNVEELKEWIRNVKSKVRDK
ncbi:hypothetical protein [Mammaliicoccus sciuri]|uniref:hypothetical protein n=1 Tax=Mammaliicoccus sciuri TaxID=1296 RepID=UPI001951D2F8|nr:hypothetical protein [Mammaliicoccus sciuri]